MTLIERFENHPKRYLFMTLFVYLFLNNTVNALSIWTESNRDGTAGFQFWEPFVWEYTSAISVFLLLPLLAFLFERYRLSFCQIKRQLAIHFLGSVAFSLGHVLLMVVFREGIYWFAGGDYQFGPWLSELFYEYRKDAWGYVTWLILFNAYFIMLARLKGEASAISVASVTESEQENTPEHFLVKKLDREFLVKVSTIDWLESAGNYVNLHADGRIYPLRSTLTELCKRLETVGFSRIHRSFGVNHQVIESISYLPSGDGEITLKTGKVLSLSRRYKDDFKQRLS